MTCLIRRLRTRLHDRRMKCRGYVKVYDWTSFDPVRWVRR